MKQENKKNSETQHDMIAIGDTTQDIFLEMSDASVQCDLDGENCRISFDYADKIAVDKKTDVPAVGNAANHAIGIARLGLESAIYTVVGKDVQGELSKEVFADNGVNPAYVSMDEERGTNFSCVINYKGERTIFVYHEPRDYQIPDFRSTRWTYLTSASGEGLKSLHTQVLDWLKKSPEVKLAFNPGTHQIHMGLEELKPILARTNALFLNREESAEILGAETSDIKELMAGYHELGVEMMIMTDGPDGAYVSDGKIIHHLGIFEGSVIERTGAGDAFGSGFMGAILQGKTVDEAMLWGNANSTSVVRYIGAREGLLTPEKIAEMIEANSGVRPDEFDKL